MKNGISLSAVATVALVAAALLPGGKSFAADTPVIALVQSNEQALFFVQMNQGAEAEAAKRGFHLVVFNANNDPAAQNNAIQTYMQQKVAGIIVDPLDGNGIVPDIKAASAAGIPVVAVDTIVPQGPQIGQVGVDNRLAGHDIGEFFVKYVAEHGGSAKVGIVGALNSSIQNVRQKGFEDVLKASPHISIAGVVDGRNVQDNALTAAENLITGNPDLTAVYATGEPALIGAIAAVETQGKQGQIKVVGWDLSASALKGVDAGYVIGVVQQDPAGMGAAAVDAIADDVGGKKIEKTRTIAVPVTIVTKDNIEPYRAVFK